MKRAVAGPGAAAGPGVLYMDYTNHGSCQRATEIGAGKGTYADACSLNLSIVPRTVPRLLCTTHV